MLKVRDEKFHRFNSKKVQHPFRDGRRSIHVEARCSIHVEARHSVSEEVEGVVRMKRSKQ